MDERKKVGQKKKKKRSVLLFERVPGLGNQHPPRPRHLGEDSIVRRIGGRKDAAAAAAAPGPLAVDGRGREPAGRRRRGGRRRGRAPVVAVFAVFVAVFAVVGVVGAVAVAAVLAGESGEPLPVHPFPHEPRQSGVLPSSFCFYSIASSSSSCHYPRREQGGAVLPGRGRGRERREDALASASAAAAAAASAAAGAFELSLGASAVAPQTLGELRCGGAPDPVTRPQAVFAFIEGEELGRGVGPSGEESGRDLRTG